MAPSEHTTLIKEPPAVEHSFRSLRNVILAFLPSAFAGFLYGYSIGAASGSIASLDEALASPMSSLMRSFLTSAEVTGALLASATAFYVGDMLGRRREILLGSSLYILGTLVTETASGGWTYALAYVGRLIYGTGIGFCMHAAPVYIAEVAPADVRGMLIALKEAFIVLGLLCGYGLVAAVEGGVPAHEQWRITWGLPGLIAVGVGAGIFVAPASPRWLVLTGQSEAAKASVRRLQPSLSDEAVAATVGEMEATVQTELAATGGETGELHKWRRLCSARRAMQAGLGLIFFQQFTGQPTVLYYAQTIFESVGFSTTAAKNANVIVGTAKLIATLISVPLVDRAGRRPLLFVGVSVMLLALLMLGMGFNTPQVDGQLQGAWAMLVVVALVAYVSGYQFGYGPISWVMIGECFPLHSRTRALGVAAVTNFGINLIVTLTSGSLNAVVSQSTLFYFYAAMCVLSLVHIHFYVPETKGKTLEQIEALLAS